MNPEDQVAALFAAANPVIAPNEITLDLESDAHVESIRRGEQLMQDTKTREIDQPHETPSRRNWLVGVAAAAAVIVGAVGWMLATGDDLEPAAPIDPPVTTIAPEPATTIAESDVLSTINGGGILAVATVRAGAGGSPFAAFGPPDGFVGFEVDLITEMAARAELTVEWDDRQFGALLDLVETGEIDMAIAQMTITAERATRVAFSDPYFESQLALMVNTEINPGIETFEDLEAGDRVIVPQGSPMEVWARENLEPLGIEIVTINSMGLFLAPLLDGSAEAGIAGTPLVGPAPLEVVDTTSVDDFYGMVFSLDNPELLDAMNAALAEMIADGTYQTIYDVWFDTQAGNIAD